MYLIIKDNDQAKKIIEKLSQLDGEISVNPTTYCITVKAPNVGGVVQVTERRIRAYKHGELFPNIYIALKDIISIIEL